MRSKEQVEAKLSEVYARREMFLDYAQDRLSVRDHHGVADAAMDLREIEQELDTLEWVLGRERKP